jgi:hypothetical protein
MHGCYENITKVDFVLTEPSQESNRRLCISVEAEATACGSAHPTQNRDALRSKTFEIPYSRPTTSPEICLFQRISGAFGLFG